MSDRLLKVETCAYCSWPCLDATDEDTQRVYCGLAKRDMFIGTEKELGNYEWAIPEWCLLPIAEKERSLRKEP